MRTAAILVVLVLFLASPAAELESRVLTHYVPQDLLEKAVRTEGWTEIPLSVPGGVRKGDVVRVWAGGASDRGNGAPAGQNVAGPAGPEPGAASPAKKPALSAEPAHAFTLLFKTQGPGYKKSPAPGKPLEISLTRDKEQFWVGFNDEAGRYQDNHLGRGRRHEFDPLWIRVEVVRTIVD